MIELQEMLAHAQADIAKMSEEMYVQQKEIAELQRQVRRLKDQLVQVSEGQESDGTPEPPPPHY